ncbi:TetR/AcrR family transcriptional regulator [Streptomyces sp. NPDC004629]|uniref:TetR/AcrR family transcriptional regulator n=1 Tax=Streptomyces sp. NPDC004629 TaxID=3364705 RepID=UPI0036842DDD
MGQDEVSDNDVRGAVSTSPSTPRPVRHRKLRADTERTRNRLLDVLGDMLQSGEENISLPALAKRAGVSTATAYRHFDHASEIRQAFYERTLETLLLELRRLSQSYRGAELYQRICETWVELGADWARTATLIRSPVGFVERLRSGDGMATDFMNIFAPVIQQMIDDGTIPDQEIEYAVLMWVTLFDERVFADLLDTFGWSTATAARTLSASLMSVLKSRGNPFQVDNR